MNPMRSRCADARSASIPATGSIDMSGRVVAEVYDSIRRQKRGEEDFGREKRYPPCMFEDLGKQVIVLLSRLSYRFDLAVAGYEKLKASEDNMLEPRLFQSGLEIVPGSWDLFSREVTIIDLGGGSGRKGGQIAMTLLGRGHKVTYVCIDGSERMLEANREHLARLEVPCRSEQLCFEDFPGVDLTAYKRQSAVTNIVLFLGNTYGNYAPEDACTILDNPTLKPTDLLVVGTGTLPQGGGGAILQQELITYSNPAMRFALLEAIGFSRRQLSSHVAYNPQRRQIEMYVFIQEVSNPTLRQLGIVSGDIFLTGIARRPTREQFHQELSQRFDTRLSLDDGHSPFYTLAFCRPRG